MFNSLETVRAVQRDRCRRFEAEAEAHRVAKVVEQFAAADDLAAVFSVHSRLTGFGLYAPGSQA